MRLHLSTIGGDATSHVFGPEGGVFGRSPKCDWVLPDPERILSSVHGRILFDTNRFILVDESTNGIFLGDRSEPLGRGNTIVLASGVTFRAARLIISAELLAADVKHTMSYPISFSAPMTSTPQGAEQALREREVWGDLLGRNSQDPLAYLDGASGPAPMSATMGPLTAPPATPIAPMPISMPRGMPQISDPLPTPELRDVALPVETPAPSARPAKLIPDDFDPLSMIVGPRGGPTSPSSFAASPAVAAEQRPLPTPSPAAALIPVEIPSTRQPLAPELMADLARLDDHQVVTPEARGGTADPLDAVEAMRARRVERKSRLIEKSAVAGLPPLPGTSAAPSMASTPPTPPAFPSTATNPASSAPASPYVAAIATEANSQEAAKALFRGMGFPDAVIPAGREMAVLHEVGEMVRAMSEGLVSLLAARKMLKSEFRMDETQVQPEENNPFKHFKIAELALDELFVTRSGGFQAPAEAAASALDDVKGHVMLTMAAMQHAIRLIVERLDPKLIAREEDEGAARLRGLGARKGKWEIYSELHQRLSGNLEGMTRQIISTAFAKVQEDQARRSASQFRESNK
ncbi:type VI secretion system-associated FHA domain protein TagH [Ciceribacter sp. L1K23]|uniref:type VI secretion system-associated FHA domain protein TagH n=1 Tax=Ciceribacter sp. L1K23 TaxID=2820276 RepID=UPI001B843F49|nr:type VI secretion system-associated FHA domain protein TagH [Ciceribacter sp. L1K23]MBR0558412.1 type VI secretion system-associated FHA domain protein TagH [Ciceribacter sp. L1K23]